MVVSLFPVTALAGDDIPEKFRGTWKGEITDSPNSPSLNTLVVVTSNSCTLMVEGFEPHVYDSSYSSLDENNMEFDDEDGNYLDILFGPADGRISISGDAFSPDFQDFYTSEPFIKQVPTTYTITNGTAQDANGSITVASSAVKDDTVIVTVTAKYTFKMPAKAVTITATFEAASAAWTGSGTEAAPYQIDTLDDLNKLATEVNNGKDMSGVYFKLTADIGNSTTPFTTPIGNYTNQFKGNFDGDGHTVYLTITGSSYLGLFGCLNGGSIQNVTTAGEVADTSTSVTGNGPVAGVCAHNIGGTIENCVNKAAVSCKNYGKYMGGICGENEGGTINGCSNSAMIKAWGYNAQYFGGICGQNYTGSILNCVNSGEVKALEWAINGMGGICGLNGGV